MMGDVHRVLDHDAVCPFLLSETHIGLGRDPLSGYERESVRISVGPAFLPTVLPAEGSYGWFTSGSSAKSLRNFSLLFFINLKPLNY